MLLLLGRQPDVSQLSELISDSEVLLSPILVDQWKAWMTDQMEEAGVEYGKNVYIGLRMDGRVRASGKVRVIIIISVAIYLLCLKL